MVSRGNDPKTWDMNPYENGYINPYEKGCSLESSYENCFLLTALNPYFDHHNWNN